jgi:hypothetical protein
MEKEMIEPKKIKALFYEIHKAIAEYSINVVYTYDGVDISYPSGVQLTSDEILALKSLVLSPDAKSGLKKLISDACSYPVFHLFSLMDGVADPDSNEIEDWYGLDFSEKEVGSDTTLHDDVL